MDNFKPGQGLQPGKLDIIYGGLSPCDLLERAIWDSNVSPEDRLVLVSRVKAVRRENEMLSARVDNQESDLH